ncbi:tRNA modification GTPase [Novosphingobium chloroacetimidivorans]|uniref:tRNA modification GTPase MnmE n=1 Tax=Novosphingobium chloroacetimidivorans TaxID=1428314 RepID=A0A7W7K8D4_9SPHN|nr:tRNA uridine-5-carboxymethylaminomethyl(34) synthesis GTPase MnmE [Novosphingobium chloroacetimidivorans]MBB4857865.1 tRNA modification GTPase [Novosphingobium chloroacetimidivorans]
MNDTIFALSSGAPPAAIGIVRISGPAAAGAVEALAGQVPQARHASLRRLRDRNGDPLDQALVLWFPGPATATGEDLAEFHLHGGRAVVAAVERTLAELPGLRWATPGEFTRRAFANGRIDLAEAEGLADLLTAETELQRRHALALASGGLSSQISEWRDQVLVLSAQVEAVLDFGDEDDVAHLPPSFSLDLARLATAIDALVAGPRAESLREGFRVVLAGPPNSGKSSLFNCLVDADAAITTPIPGTTRDVLTRPVALQGIPFLFVDTAGLRSDTQDAVELIGIDRATQELSRADLVLWLGPEGEGQGRCVWELDSFADLASHKGKVRPRHRVSAETGAGIAELQSDLIDLARTALPGPNQFALNQRQGTLLLEAAEALHQAGSQVDPLLIAELLRNARSAFDRLLGRAATEDMLDALFGRFCIGK